MPVFTFEKISPPADRGPIQATEKNNVKKQRGLIVQILDRFVEARASRSLRKERSILARKTSKA